MRGRYLIYTPVVSTPDEKRFDRAWSKFADVCRSLHRDGLAYEVRFNMGAFSPHVLITANGTPTPRTHPAARRYTLNPPATAQHCKDRALEAAWFLPENVNRRKDGTAYWRKHRARYQELSVMAEEFLRAEYEFWRELELLSGQRQHFKPGLSDDTRCSDDEVAA